MYNNSKHSLNSAEYKHTFILFMSHGRIEQIIDDVQMHKMSNLH